MFRLDYISCVLTISSTILVGRKRWEGWLVAGLNSVLICVIAVNTAQLGFIPANLFCLALYSYNIWEWRKSIGAPKELHLSCPETQSLAVPGEHHMQVDVDAFVICGHDSYPRRKVLTRSFLPIMDSANKGRSAIPPDSRWHNGKRNLDS